MADDLKSLIIYMKVDYGLNVNRADYIKTLLYTIVATCMRVIRYICSCIFQAQMIKTPGRLRRRRLQITMLYCSVTL